MLLLTKLDKTRVLVTLETVKYIEETPDTLVRFLNGESIIVRESLDEVSALVDEMRIRFNGAASEYGGLTATNEYNASATL